MPSKLYGHLGSEGASGPVGKRQQDRHRAKMDGFPRANPMAAREGARQPLDSELYGDGWLL